MKRRQQDTRFTPDVIDEIVHLQEHGFSYRKIGAIYGVSGQRIHQVITGYRSPSHFVQHGATRSEALALSIARNSLMTDRERIEQSVSKYVADPEAASQIIDRVEAIRARGY